MLCNRYIPLCSLLTSEMANFPVTVSFPLGKSVPSCFLHVILGIGYPSASQDNSADLPTSASTMASESSIIVGSIFTSRRTSSTRAASTAGTTEMVHKYFKLGLVGRRRAKVRNA